MARRLHELLRGGVAAEAAHVRVWPSDLDWLLVRPGGVAPHVAEPVELGADGAAEPVVGVTGVALAFLDVAVLEVRRRERIAVSILQIGDERRHHVARPARLHARAA